VLTCVKPTAADLAHSFRIHILCFGRFLPPRLTLSFQFFPPQFMRRIVAFSALVEMGTGLGLLIAPAVVVALLTGRDFSDAWSPLSRCFGIAIVALGLACWPERQRAESGSPAFRGLLTYNTLIALYLASLGTLGQWRGLFLWLAVALHAVVALLLIWAWREGRRHGRGGSG
jgi:hypothetical protein